VASVTLIAPRQRSALSERSVRRTIYRCGYGRVAAVLGGGRRDACIAPDDVRFDDRSVRLR
jgi:hypothetical protein